MIVPGGRWLAVLLLWVGQAKADYLEIIPQFWRNLYPDGGVGLYCGKRFGAYDRRYNIEHVFPMGWVVRQLRCGDREQCRRRSALFNRIESDMHNLYPVRRDLNRERGTYAYGIIKGERWVERGCDFELDHRRRRAEPRPKVRGDIARAMLYMADTYDLKLFRRQRELLERWHRADPPDAEERRRNRIIRRLQGRGNPWIERD
jgi:deoxyribonuclease-1